MQLGKIKLEVPLVLAPMAGVTDLPFRILCREQGCALTVSEMVSAKGLLYNNVKTFEMLQIDPLERPTAIQLFGSVPQELATAAKMVAQSGADLIDFNMGCPVPKVVNNGEGSALMKTPALAYEVLARLVDAVQIPVTVKMRAGWNENLLNAPQVAELAERAGVAAVAVHGRTREQFYNGQADWSMIKAVKQAVHIPVFGNGDIRSAADGLEMLASTGCDGLMVGRGADGNPWLFAELKAALLGAPLPGPVTVAARFALVLRHLQMLIAFKGEKIAVKEMRRHACTYTKGLPGSAAYRSRFHEVNTAMDVAKLLAEYEQKLNVEKDKNLC
ncbi:MAG: tRNA dihydrouridine synthase DusB [Acidaminococcaceae bacterium]